METSIYANPKLKLIKWKDLVVPSKKQVINELTLPLPWLVLSLAMAYFEWWIPALLFSFIFFLAGLRQVHNAYHYALGISNKSTEWVIYLESVIMLASMHAVKYNHLQHHKHCLSEKDIEGMSARMSGFKALVFGPVFPLLLHYNAWKNANSNTRKWILLELISITLFVVFVLGFSNLPWLKYHLVAMTIGECMTAFFAVWTVHHDCEDQPFQSRTVRGWFKSTLTYNMFYHTEHHLFPQVPTCNLPVLAERIDEVMPEVQAKKVF